MISAEEARKMLTSEDELKEKRINEVVDQVLSLIEIDITRAAKINNLVTIPVRFSNLGDYGWPYSNFRSADRYKHIFIERVDNKKIFYGYVMKSEERFEVIIRVFDKLSKLGYTSNLDIEELSNRALSDEGELYVIKISWE